MACRLLTAGIPVMRARWACKSVPPASSGISGHARTVVSGRAETGSLRHLVTTGRVQVYRVPQAPTRGLSPAQTVLAPVSRPLKAELIISIDLRRAATCVQAVAKHGDRRHERVVLDDAHCEVRREHAICSLAMTTEATSLATGTLAHKLLRVACTAAVL